MLETSPEKSEPLIPAATKTPVLPKLTKPDVRVLTEGVPYAMPCKSCVLKAAPGGFHVEFPLLSSPPASLGVAVTEGVPDPPGPPLDLALIEKAYVVPLINPVITVGEDTLTSVAHAEVQLCMSIVVPTVLHIQYSTPGCIFHERVALVSPATTLTLIGAEADEPPPPQPTKRMVTTITMINAKNRLISMTNKWKPNLDIFFYPEDTSFPSGVRTFADVMNSYSDKEA